uniref:Uncharacterized protein n=1 Tax=Hucho hucho TaxID=62062 RepID=A0A4W5MZG0_9TELE
TIFSFVLITLRELLLSWHHTARSLCHLNDGVGVVPGRAVMSEQGVTEETEQAPLRGPRVEDQSVLVNMDNFEFVGWIEEEYGAVPHHAVKTCPGVEIYVGKNKYGLGKVVTQHQAFCLYQVLAINRDAYSQSSCSTTLEALQFVRVTNLECSSVEKMVLLEKTSTMDFTKQQTVSFSESTTMVECIRNSISVELLVPPNHSCAVRMEGRKMTADSPFTGRLSRTYHNGDTHWTTITGTCEGGGD